MPGSLAQKVAFSTGLNVIQQIIIAISSILVARWVGPDVLGLLAYATAYVGLFVAIADFGTGTAHVKRISEGRDHGQCMGTMWFLRVFFILLTVMVVCTVKAITHNSSFITSEGRWVFYLAVTTFVFTQLAQVPWATFVAHQNVLHKDMPPTVIQGGMSLVRLAVAAIGLGAVGLAFVDMTTSILLLFVYIWLLRSVPVARPDKDSLKSYLSFGAPVFLCSIFTGVGDKIDRILLQSMGGLAAVGQYSAGMRLGSVLQFLSQAVATLLFPSLSRAYANGNPGEAFDLCSRAERYLGLVLFPAMLGIVGVSRALTLLLLGQKYADTGSVFAFGTVAMIFLALTQPYRQIFGGAEKMKAMVVLNCIFLVIQVASLFFFLKYFHVASFGLVGAASRAALATAVSSFMGALLWRFAAVRLLGAHLDKRIWIHIGSAIILFALVYCLTYSGKVLGLSYSFALGAGAVALHLFSLYSLHELKEKDWFFLRRLLVLPRRR